MKYQNDFNKDDKLRCNVGKILKESIFKFLGGRITSTLKVDKEDIVMF